MTPEYFKALPKEERFYQLFRYRRDRRGYPTFAQYVEGYLNDFKLWPDETYCDLCGWGDTVRNQGYPSDPHHFCHRHDADEVRKYMNGEIPSYDEFVAAEEGRSTLKLGNKMRTVDLEGAEEKRKRVLPPFSYRGKTF